MASSTGSDVFALLALTAISLAVLLILRHYLPLRTTPAYLSVPIFLALVLPISAILLVPIDLASSAKTTSNDSKGIWLPERAVLVSWRITYWLTFVLTWLVLPLLGEYMDAGYRDAQARMIYSLRSNGRYQLIVLSCAVAGLVYMILSYGFDFTAIKGVVMALAYGWGLILAIYLMGHGLVAVPRRMLRHADIAGSLRMVQSQAPKVHEKLEDAIITLEDIETQIQQLKQRKTGTARQFQEWIDDLADMTGQLPVRVTLATPELNTSSIPNVITERYLADVTRRFTRAGQSRVRYIEEWDGIVRKACKLQAILDSMASRKLSFNRETPTGWSRYTRLSPWMRFYLHFYIVPAFRYLLFAVFSLASLAILQSEMIRPWRPQYSIVSLTVIHAPNTESYQIGFGGQILASIWITYMVFCALSSMTVVPTWNQRALVRRNTHPESACWYAGQIAKLTVPLAFNFLTFLPPHIQENNTFYNFLGKLINLTPLGKWFDNLFPIFILIPVLATLFNLYGKVKHVFGFGLISDEEDEETSAFAGGWREGRDLIARDLAGPNAPGSLGLTSSPRGSLDTRRNQPSLWVPPAHSSRSASPNPSTAAAASSAAAARQQSRLNRGPVVLEPEPEEENFFVLFGRRVKNTFESIDTPKWMQNDNTSGSSGTGINGGLKRPKWMGGGSDSESGSSEGFVDRLFGNVGGSAGRSSNGNNSNSRDGRILL